MKITTNYNQELEFTARTGKGAVVLSFARAKAPAAWAKLPEVRRGPAPVVTIDVGALAKERDVDAAAVMVELRKDPLFRDLEKTGGIVVS